MIFTAKAPSPKFAPAFWKRLARPGLSSGWFGVWRCCAVDLARPFGIRQTDAHGEARSSPRSTRLGNQGRRAAGGLASSTSDQAAFTRSPTRMALKPPAAEQEDLEAEGIS